ncbi:hypothetical protein AWZ03_004044 [Drosophila navojoa]|uniref:Uncharacterized protein n=2 Tax=Drosophila navojoa TaxID=7232 RepID=A0A484BLA4_DRONA|nr:hypothetical protein AWZ03_004044 [Drosophila navojoa]
MQQDANEDDQEQPEHIDGRSFFFLGTLFRRWRDRWLAFHGSAPLFAGAAFPLNGYFNCPSYGCNPAAIGPQPGGFYQTYYASPIPPQPQQQQQQQQHQQAQGNSNVYIYQSDQNMASSVPQPPYGPGFFGPARQPTPLTPPPPRPLPLPLPPPAPLPLLPSAMPPPQGSASSFGFGPGPGPGTVPLPACGPNSLSCAFG